MGVWVGSGEWGEGSGELHLPQEFAIAYSDL